MRRTPTAMAVIASDSPTPDWHRAQIQRLARHLGYALVWPPDSSLLPLTDQVRQADVDAVLVAAPDHLDVLTLNSLMSMVDAESACPRLTFNRWAHTRAGLVR